MKKIVMVLFLFIFCVTEETIAGGIILKFVVTDTKSQRFAEEFGSQMKQYNEVILEFLGLYFINGYIGKAKDKKTNKEGSAIGIFVNSKELHDPVDCIWMEELFSDDIIIIKAKESAEKIFQYLLELEKKRKSILSWKSALVIQTEHFYFLSGMLL